MESSRSIYAKVQSVEKERKAAGLDKDSGAGSESEAEAETPVAPAEEEAQDGRKRNSVIRLRT